MHSYFISILLNHSIIIPALIAIIRFPYINRNYYPFIFMIWLGLINETLSLILIYYNRSNLLNSNLYVLLEYLIILIQFFKWNGSQVRRYYLIAFIGTLVWVADNQVIHTFNDNNSIFRIFYSFVIVFSSINQVNKILIYEKRSLVKNAMFIICITFLLYYGCKAYVEAFNLFNFGISRLFLWNLWIILYFINFTANILYSFAILWITTKQEFTML